MRQPEYFLGEGEFTEMGRHARAAADGISGPFLECVDSLLKSFGSRTT